MRTEKKATGMSAANIYLKALERALGLDSRASVYEQTLRTTLPGGCILYHVPLQRWLRNRH